MERTFTTSRSSYTYPEFTETTTTMRGGITTTIERSPGKVYKRTTEFPDGSRMVTERSPPPLRPHRQPTYTNTTIRDRQFEDEFGSTITSKTYGNGVDRRTTTTVIERSPKKSFYTTTFEDQFSRNFDEKEEETFVRTTTEYPEVPRY